MDEFVKFLRERASTVSADDYVQPIKDLQSLVEQNDNLRSQFDLAFETGAKKQAWPQPYLALTLSLTLNLALTLTLTLSPNPTGGGDSGEPRPYRADPNCKELRRIRVLAERGHADSA